jgi:hypothetical protein
VWAKGCKALRIIIFSARWRYVIILTPCTLSSRFDSRRGLGIFLFTTASRTALGLTQPRIQWVPGALSLGVKWLGREVDHIHLVPRSRIRGAIPILPHYVFMAWFLVKHKDNFTFTFAYWIGGWVSLNEMPKGKCVKRKYEPK